MQIKSLLFNDNQRIILKLLLTDLIIFDWLNSYYTIIFMLKNINK